MTACDAGNRTTSHFRRTFVVADASLVTGLTLGVLRDDGAVVYLNGTEVWRDNLPAGPIDFLTPALSGIEPGAPITVVPAPDPALPVDGRFDPFYRGSPRK